MTELVLEDADRWLQVSLERRRTPPPGVKYGTESFCSLLGRKSSPGPGRQVINELLKGPLLHKYLVQNLHCSDPSTLSLPELGDAESFASFVLNFKTCQAEKMRVRPYLTWKAPNCRRREGARAMKKVRMSIGKQSGC